MDLSSNRYIKRSFCDIRLDHRPERLCFRGSGFPRPEEGAFDRSISLSNLHKALCNRLSFSRITSYASQVLPSKTSDLIHLLARRFIACFTAVGVKRVANLLHEILVLEHVEGFLFSLPVLSADYHESLSGSSRYFERLVPANYLLYNTFKVIPEFVYANCVHNGTFMYGFSVQVYEKSPNKTKHGDASFVAASPSLKPRVLRALCITTVRGEVFHEQA